MSWFLCDRIGTGTEEDPYRPAVHDYDIPWSATVEFEQRSKFLVSCEEQPGFGADSRIVPMAKAVFANEIPDDGEDDGQDSPALALKVVRRALLENLLGTDDVWNAHGPSLVSTLNPGARGLAIAKMAQAGINPGQIVANTKVDDVLRTVLPQIPARVLPGNVGNSGSFTDNFNGEGSNVDLASHTPSGGTAWARQDGSSGDILVTTGGITQTTGAAVYWCDDQGSSDQYTQGVIQATTTGAFLIIRSSDASNFWGVRARSNGQCYKRVSGTYVLVGTGGGDSVGDVLRIEGSGSNIETFLDTGSGFSSFTGPHNDSFNSTATRQGLGGSSFGAGSFMDDFEAGVLSATHTGAASLSIPPISMAASGHMVPEATSVLNVAAAGLTASGHMVPSAAVALSVESAELASSGSFSTGAYAINAVDFDGSTHLNRGADLTGSADSKLVTGHFWVKFANAASSNEIIWASGGLNLAFVIARNTSEAIGISAKNSGGSTILDVRTSLSSVADTDWNHAVFSFDLSDTGKRHLYLDDVSDLNITTYTNDTIDFTRAEHEIGGIFSGSLLLPFSGCLAQLWLYPGVYIDLSVEANRRKFVGASIGYVDLGSDGSTPTGSAPLVFLDGATASWHTNKGGGGGFTENGTLTDCADAPSSASATGAGALTAALVALTASGHVVPESTASLELMLGSLTASGVTDMRGTANLLLQTTSLYALGVGPAGAGVRNRFIAVSNIRIGL